MLRNLKDLNNFLPKLPPQRLVVACGHDEYIIEAITMAQKLGIIKPILIGESNTIKDLIVKMNYQLSDYQIINANSDEEASTMAVAMIRDNGADILMKGLLDTKTLLKAVVNKETGIRESKVLSHIALLSYPDYPRVIFASDCAMIISPTVEEKAHIIDNAVALTKSLGYDKPLVGMVSAVEKVNPKIQSTVDASLIIEMYQNNPDCIVDGPFAIDNLVSMDSVTHKNIKSVVGGKADILIFPNIEAGNVFYKTSVFLANAQVAGIVLGAKCPIVLTSRADSSQSKLSSIILSAVYNYGKTNLSH